MSDDGYILITLQMALTQLMECILKLDKVICMPKMNPELYEFWCEIN